MKRVTSILSLMVGLMLTLCLPVMKVNGLAGKPDIAISQFKVTSSNGQFFMLYNSTDKPIDMGLVQLVYFNNYNLTSATSTKIIQLSGELPAHQYYLVNDGPLTLCYRMFINSVSLGLSSTAGTIQVQRLAQAAAGGAVTTTLEDYVSWSKSSVNGVQKLPTDTQEFLLRQPVDSSQNPNIANPGQGSWQAVKPAANDPCLLTTTSTTVPPSTVMTSLLLLSSTPPPVTIISIAAGGGSGGAVLPARDIGLMAPVINELAPNPAKPLTDAEDEFIELYNPNDKVFDLTGFSLEVGTATKYKKKFANGTLLKPKSFTAFFSSGTSLALTNSGSQARLLDPFGSIISQSKTYSAAKDGQAWALANNDWYWTSQPTPNNANVINGASNSGQGAGGGQGGAVQGSSTTGGTGLTASAVRPSSQAQVATLHPSTLAGVAALALGYGAYEYRQDIANRFRQLRNYRANRRSPSS